MLLTLRQCSQAGPAGIFRYYLEVVSAQTGLTSKMSARAMRELEAAGWIEVEGVVVWIKNALRDDPHIRLADDKHRTAVERAIAALPRQAIVLRFCDYYQLARPFEGSPQDPSQGLPKTPARPPSPSPTLASTPARVEGGPGGTGDDAFERFWATYPKHRGKEAAKSTWDKIKPDEVLSARIIEAVEAQKSWSDWTKDGGQFIPYAATWLNRRQWEDEALPRAATHDPRRINDRWANQPAGEVAL